MGGVDADDVDVGGDQGLDPLVVVHADGGPDPQPAAGVPGGPRELLDAVDVPHGDQAGQLALAVDQQQLLDLVRSGGCPWPLRGVVSGGAVTRLALVMTVLISTS